GGRRGGAEPADEGAPVPPGRRGQPVPPPPADGGADPPPGGDGDRPGPVAVGSSGPRRRAWLGCSGCRCTPGVRPAPGLTPSGRRLTQGQFFTVSPGSKLKLSTPGPQSR